MDICILYIHIFLYKKYYIKNFLSSHVLPTELADIICYFVTIYMYYFVTIFITINGMYYLNAYAIILLLVNSVIFPLAFSRQNL